MNELSDLQKRLERVTAERDLLFSVVPQDAYSNIKDRMVAVSETPDAALPLPRIYVFNEDDWPKYMLPAKAGEICQPMTDMEVVTALNSMVAVLMTLEEQLLELQLLHKNARQSSPHVDFCIALLGKRRSDVRQG